MSSRLAQAYAWLGTPRPRITPYRLAATVPPLAALAVGGLVLAGIEVPWLLDLCAHWVQPALVGALLMSAVGAARQRLLSLATAVMCGTVLVLATPFEEPARLSEAEGASLTLASVNVLSSNREFARVKDWISTSNPDVLAVLEVSPYWAENLKSLAEYPHQKIVSRPDNFGIALLSKFPLDAVEVLQTPWLLGSTPSISAVVQSPEHGPFRVLATHPVPPVSAEALRARNAQVVHLARVAAAYPGPSVLMGDFNATPWSSAILLARQQGLHPVSGTQPTWPAKKLPTALIPIDHILANGAVTRVGAAVGPGVGSDHFPVLVKVRLQQGNHDWSKPSGQK